MKFVVLATLLTLVFGQNEGEQQLSLCDQTNCKTAFECMKKGKEAHRTQRDETKKCMDACALAAGLDSCFQRDDSGKDKIRACVDENVCNAENIENVRQFMQNSPFGQRGFGGKHKGKGGKGKHCGGKHKGKLQEMFQKMGITSQTATTFASCTEACFANVNCDEEEQPACQMPCDLHPFGKAAMYTCFKQQGETFQRRDHKEKCRCIANALGGDATVCDQMRGRRPRRWIPDLEEY